MASSPETGGEQRGGRITGFLKRFNKISAAVFISAGVVFESEILIGLGLLDVAQAWGWGKLERWNQSRKASSKVGNTALAGAAY